MIMKLSISTLITIITLAIGVGGAYYTITNKIDHLEAKVKVLQKKINKKLKARALN